jgi:hypothetical protein
MWNPNDFECETSRKFNAIFGGLDGAFHLRDRRSRCGYHQHPTQQQEPKKLPFPPVHTSLQFIAAWYLYPACHAR